jgi:hypothetical protein
LIDDGYSQHRRRATRDYLAAFERMRAGWSPADLRRARELGVDVPKLDLTKQAKRADDDEPRETQAAATFEHPVDLIEPEEGDPALEAAAVFAAIVAWMRKGATLVQVGHRVVAALSLVRADLVGGARVCVRLAHDAGECLGGSALEVGEAYGAVWAWLREAQSIAQLGVRCLAMAYVISSQGAEGVTLEQIGAGNGTTRQAVDRIAQNFRDTFHGMRSRTMRSEENRKRCRIAQLK